MRVADGALREGLLYDLVGRLTDEDARVRSVRAMQGRYHVDIAQSERVEATALGISKAGAWSSGVCEEPFAELMLSWAARLHEIGLDVSHSQYQKHGAYLLEHADMPGFPQDEQKILACIVGSHRRKLNLSSLAGSVASLAYQGRVPDGDPASGRVAAQRPQQRRIAEDRACGEGALAGDDLSRGLARRSPADGCGSGQ